MTLIYQKPCLNDPLDTQKPRERIKRRGGVPREKERTYRESDSNDSECKCDFLHVYFLNGIKKEGNRSFENMDGSLVYSFEI